MTQTIQNKQEFRTALDQYWIATSLIKEAKEECKEEKKRIMSKIALMVKEVDALLPALRDYMLQEGLTSISSKGKTFHLKYRKSKTKLSNDEIAEMLRKEEVDEDAVQAFMNVAAMKKEKTSSHIKCEVEEVVEEV